ncbi:MAG: glutathione peroxidase [Chitinophagaceae bacterium]|nr:glutathione peroxidase [Chitinophagaceae bacterium]
MSWRRKLLFRLYPVLMRAGRFLKKNAESLKGNTPPKVSFFELKAVTNNGTVLDFGTLRGKKTLIVNTASDCGYTRQYEELQQLWKLYGASLTILAFPSNDFKQQEKGSDEEISAFCQTHYGIRFPLMKKCVVVKSPDQHEVYRWLSNAAYNGWNDRAPAWNFYKYLVDENGDLKYMWGSSVSPLSREVMEAVKT